ncbi:MAG: VCBS repeat-containing protein [Bdellovibrio sp.]|nr:MAG: VCBS repeat-containing protein [Bdellovibrio sp.]
MNADGYNDILTGIPNFTNAAGNVAGKIEVYSGKDGSLLWSLEGDNSSQSLGFHLDAHYDFNGDGVNDLIYADTGASGVAGANTGKIFIRSGVNGSLLYSREGSVAGERIGQAIIWLKDFNGDGKVDYAYTHYKNGNSTFPQVSVYSGADHSLLFNVSGYLTSSNFGSQLSELGDLDGDGNSELMVADPSYSISTQKRGRLYIYKSSP